VNEYHIIKSNLFAHKSIERLFRAKYLGPSLPYLGLALGLRLSNIKRAKLRYREAEDATANILTLGIAE